jgi:hypothetical protein
MGVPTSPPTAQVAFTLRLVGAYQLYGGIAGLDATLRASRAIASVASIGRDPIGVLLWVTTAALFGLLAYAGAALLWQWRGGRAVTLLAQALQSVMVGGSFGGIVFSAGVYSGVLLESGRLSLIYGWALNAQLGTESSRTFIAVNVVPLIIAATVLVWMRGARAPGQSSSVQPQSVDSNV